MVVRTTGGQPPNVFKNGAKAIADRNCPTHHVKQGEFLVVANARVSDSNQVLCDVHIFKEEGDADIAAAFFADSAPCAEAADAYANVSPKHVAKGVGTSSIHHMITAWKAKLTMPNGAPPDRFDPDDLLGKYVNGMECDVPSGWNHWGGLTCTKFKGVKLGGTYTYANASQWQVDFDALRSVSVVRVFLRGDAGPPWSLQSNAPVGTCG